MVGLHKTKSSTASLLLNLETAFTVAIACLIFRERYARRLVLGFVLLLVGGGILSFSGNQFGGDALGMVAIAGACVGWAIDNNLTKYVGSLDATVLAALKGVIAGIVNVTLALSLGQQLPSAAVIGSSLAIGFVGYGLSLVLFILSLRKIGAARTSAYFSTAPFAGAAIAIILLHEPITWVLGISGILMAIGVYLHLTETHAHEHAHEALEHEQPPGVEKVVEGYSTDIFADAACDYIRKHTDKPFFLNVPFNAAHLKQEAKPEDLAKFQHIENPKRRMAAAIIANLDANIGRIANQLRASGLDRNTLFVFLSDNGGEPPILGTSNGALRGKKFDVYEGGIRVPFFVRWPGTLPSGKTSDALVSVIDLLPTIAAATSTSAPANIDGKNLLPHLTGKTQAEPHTNLFWRTTKQAALQRMRNRAPSDPPSYIPHIAAVREGKWKLVVLDDAGKNQRVELYDLTKDISETNDVSATEPDVVRRLTHELDTWRSTLKRQVIPPRPKQ
jgi:threonine/homoserine efflux transporter RhtA